MYPGQLNHIKRASWRVKPIHVTTDHIETHPLYPKRRLNDRHARRVEQSVQRKGLKDEKPLRVRPHPTKKGHYQVIDGHRRLEAARRAHPDGKIPIVVVEDYPEEKYDNLYKKKPWWKRLFGL